MWPRSHWRQAGIALAIAIPVSIFVFVRVNNTHFERYAREYPHDGQDGLGALMDAFQAGFYTLIGAFLCLFILQRLIAAIRCTGSRRP
jgi:hypothetical protein